MDPSVLGTGQLVLSRASSATSRLSVHAPLPPGCADSGCTPPVGSSCVVQGVTVDPRTLFLSLKWSPPSGSPADLPLLFTYKSDNSNSTELGANWSGPYHRFAENMTGIIPNAVSVNTPVYVYGYLNNGTSYSVSAPAQNTLVGNATTGWTETQPNGTSFVYYNTGVLNYIKNRAGVRWTLTWDAGFNNVQAIRGPFGRRTTFVYNASKYLRRIVAPDGRITTLTINANGDLSQIISPELCTTSFVYSASHQLRAWINPLGDRTSFIYQSSTVFAVQQPMGQRNTYTSRTGIFPPTPTTTTITNPRNALTTLQFGILSSVNFLFTDPFGNQATNYWFNTTSQQTQAIKDARGVRTSFTYQLQNNGAYLVSGIQKTGYNSGTGQGQYSFLYNNNNQVKAVVDEVGNRSTFVWDSLGNRAAVIDPYGARTSYIYDSMGRLSAVRNALGQRATQTYDSQGRRLADINPLGQRTTYAYDVNSQRLRVTDPLGHRTSYQFDSASRQTLRIDARGFRTSYVFDNDDRLTSRRYPDGTRVTFVYDNAGRRTLLNDATGRTTTTYDADGRTTLVVNPAGLRLTYAYDAASRRKYLVEPEGARFTYVFDADGRTSYVANPQGQRATWSYDSASRVTGIHFASTTRASYLYDHADRLLRVANLTSTNTTLSSFSYALDAVGNRLRVVESTGNRVTWTYDNTYQLKNEQRSGSNSYNITYTYDPVGNRLTEINGGVRTTSTYNSANELTKTQVAAGATTITYDANGNLLLSRNPSNQRTSYTWDFENRLTQVALPTGVPNTFVYNADGQRVQKQDSTGTAKHVWDRQNILLETDGSNIVQVVYTLQPALFGNLLSQRRSGTTSFYLFDGLGSTTQLTNSAGGVTDSYIFDSWGDLLLAGTTSNRFKYVGRIGYYFNSDLFSYYIRARHYDPATGRFLSRDPLRRGIRANLYRYVDNNPLISTDPSGLDPFFGWEHGNYCGWNKRAKCPPGSPGQPKPVDSLDAACEIHDCCQARWWTCNPLHLAFCSSDLCAAASESWYVECNSTAADKPSSDACEVAALQVMALFCPLGLAFGGIPFLT